MKIYICGQITLFKIPIRGSIEEILLSPLFQEKLHKDNTRKNGRAYLKQFRDGIDYLGELHFRVWPQTYRLNVAEYILGKSFFR